MFCLWGFEWVSSAKVLFIGLHLPTVARPHHPNIVADSHLAREPVYKPHVGPRFVVDLSVLSIGKGPKSQKGMTL